MYHCSCDVAILLVPDLFTLSCRIARHNDLTVCSFVVYFFTNLMNRQWGGQFCWRLPAGKVLHHVCGGSRRGAAQSQPVPQLRAAPRLPLRVRRDGRRGSLQQHTTAAGSVS